MKNNKPKYRVRVCNMNNHICVFVQMLDLYGKNYTPVPPSHNKSSICDLYKINYRYDIYEATFFEKLLGFSNKKRIKMAIKNCNKWIEKKYTEEDKFKNLYNEFTYCKDDN